MKRCVALAVLMHLGGLAAEAAPTLPGLFSDHMVLQQGKPIPVWGYADPGERIRVTLADRSTQVTTAADGRWRAVLEPLAGGGPLTLVVEGKQRLQIRDVLVGEVWVASGQSNMHLPLRNSETAAMDLAAASHAALRLFTVPRSSALRPVERSAGRWVACTPDAAAGFSAVAYHFGLELQRRLGVPIGLVQSSWPGTSAEEWIDAATLSGEPDFMPILERWRRVDRRSFGPEDRPYDFEIFLDDVRLVSEQAQGTEPVLIGDFKQAFPRNALGGEWSYSWDSAPLSLIEMSDRGGPGPTGKVLRSAGQLRSSDAAQLRLAFLRNGEPTDLSPYSGIRFRCRGRGFLKVHLLQPSIADWDNYSSGVIAAGEEWTDVSIRFSELKQAGWGVRRAFTPEALSGIVIEILPGPDGARAPSGLFNGMIAPLVPYALRGVIWYQGEGNAGRAYQYRKLLPALIRSWRSAWQQGEFPFLVVQLPNFGPRAPEPSESEWAELREAQLMALKVPGAGLAVTIDVGDANDVHPRNKKTVGLRLARWALGDVYGGDEARSGPLFESARVEGARVRVRFEDTGSGLVALDGKRLRGFAIAGADRRFFWADAVIDGPSVVVSSSEVPAPVAVRYAWAGNPDCNLGNTAGLPASPFRSDDWPGVTTAAR